MDEKVIELIKKDIARCEQQTVNEGSYQLYVLMEIYREVGYSDRDAAVSIVENNLFGMDIDKRAYQLAYFAVMMKARSYNRRALTKGISNKRYCFVLIQLRRNR